ncbi:MAG: N-acetyltransferase [Deltaproteobacteria bacterium]|nr:N-acetyltransferase [Deltaproteobacteria bacterium]
MSQASIKDYIRKPRINEAGQIHRILGHFGGQGLLLPRSLSEIYEHIRDFFILENSSENGQIIGVCALDICWEDLAEIRSLAVMESFRGRDFGTLLANKCLEEAVSMGVKKVFALTYVTDFFSKMGFKKIDKAALPHKIWADCLKCPKFPDCDETAMMKNI